MSNSNQIFKIADTFRKNKNPRELRESLENLGYIYSGDKNNQVFFAQSEEENVEIEIGNKNKVIFS